MKQKVVAVLLSASLASACAAKPMALGPGRSAIPPRPAGATYPGWEHHCAAIDGSMGLGDALAKFLADAGKEGWELVLSQDINSQLYFCFKRPLVAPDAPSSAASSGAEPVVVVPGSTIEPATADEIARAIRLRPDGVYEIDATFVARMKEDPLHFWQRGARLVPAMENGQPAGFKLYAIRPTSLFARLGFLNGDTVRAINAFSLASAEQALEVYSKLRDATSLEVELVRRGQPVTLRYLIR